MTTACQRAGIDRITPHDLRHTAASLAVQAGAHLKVFQRMLEHATAAVTLDVYAALFDSDLGAVADAMEAAHSWAQFGHTPPRSERGRGTPRFRCSGVWPGPGYGCESRRGDAPPRLLGWTGARRGQSSV
ncbi:tyrosine-type recombinase/integrase [Brevibacterium sp. BRM-1]|uniref:tyrosine-type recombinase/integrase n=1 Tax=Brevibacterium sp. BRM-1 TaxID=2999062 RepID=UPI003FA43720